MKWSALPPRARMRRQTKDAITHKINIKTKARCGTFVQYAAWKQVKPTLGPAFTECGHWL